MCAGTSRYEKLRTGAGATITQKPLGPLAPGGARQLLPVGLGGRQLDLSVSFALPSGGGSAGVRYGVALLRSADGQTSTDIYMQKGVVAPRPAPAPVLKTYMNDTDLPGGDYHYFPVRSRLSS